MNQEWMIRIKTHTLFRATEGKCGMSEKLKVYEPKPEPCKICNERQSLLLPLCEIDGEVKMFPVCLECQNKVPYEIIPVTTTLGELCICCSSLD